MGQTEARSTDDAGRRREYMRALLRDVQALEIMLREGRIESGVDRIGAEQEFVLVDESWRPRPIAEQLLQELDDPRFTTELAAFNLEYNLAPLQFEGDCLSRLEHNLAEGLGRLRAAAAKHNAAPILAGILPSLTKDDLSLANLTDRPRYHDLNRALTRMRGGAYTLAIKGLDELNITHDSVMLEACNTSFQIHFQVGPEDFARKYNFAQAVAAPVLAAAANSPILFGRRLWRETRIALLQQSIDTRGASIGPREFQPRVSFGTHWIDDSALGIFQEDIARFKSLFHIPPEEDPIALLQAEARAPALSALRLHNGTVYRWNRPCYGVANNQAHLRIENRVLPAGPSIVDEVANAAFWFGLMRGVGEEYADITAVMDFDDAAANFLSAAQSGLEAQLTWIGGGQTPARELLALRLIPLARQGLTAAGIAAPDIEKYLGIIERRAATGRNGASWAIDSLAAMRNQGSSGARMTALTAAMARHQKSELPVHEWPDAQMSDAGLNTQHIMRVGQYMTTDLFTVHEQDVIDFAASLMQWKHLRHIPVEDDEHRLVGIVSSRDILAHLLSSQNAEHPVAVAEVMAKDPISATPDTSTDQAMQLMLQHRIGCLPVVKDGRLVGIITDHDILTVARPLLEAHLRGTVE